MNDSQTREFLRVIAEMLKTQMVYLAKLHENSVALYDALKRDHPELVESLREEMEIVRLNPLQDRQIQNIDAIIQQLKG